MRTTLLTLTILALAAVANAQAWYTTTTTLRDTSVRVTADTALAVLDISQTEQLVVSIKLQDLGGSGTYAPLILTSIDGLEYDTLRADTLTAEEQNTVVTLSIYDNVKTGGGGNTAAGANTVGVALTRYLKVYIDEVGADTGGSELWAQVFQRKRKLNP